jgi:hypothetical protein
VPDQLLEGHVDQVGQVVAGARRLQAGLHDQLLGRGAIGAHAKKLPDQCGVPIPGRAGVVGLQLLLRHIAQGGAAQDVAYDGGRDVGVGGKVAQALKGFN